MRLINALTNVLLSTLLAVLMAGATLAMVGKVVLTILLWSRVLW